MKNILKIAVLSLLASYSQYALSYTCPAKLSDVEGSELVPTGSGIALDNERKKMWVDCRLISATEYDCGSDQATMSWYDLSVTMTEINEKGLFGYTDWRIPTTAELFTVIDRKCYVVEYSERRFDAEIPAANYWINKPYVLNSKIAYDVRNNHSYTIFGYYPYINRYVHLIRDKS